MNLPSKIFFSILGIIAAVAIIAGIMITDTAVLKTLYKIEFICSAIVLVIIGIEDKRSLQVSWGTTAVYALVTIPAIVSGVHSGAMYGQLVYYIAGAVFGIFITIYSARTGRSGADRDICLLTILPFPAIGVLALLVSLIVSVIATAIKKKKIPLLFIYAQMVWVFAGIDIGSSVISWVW